MGTLFAPRVYRGPNAPAEILAELDALLASWRFDQVPAGDPGWAIAEARRLLPAEVDPRAFPLRDGRRAWNEGVVRGVQTEAVGETVQVTFTYRWDAPATGGLPDDCPPDRCRWWRFEAQPSGEVVLLDQGGAEPPTPLSTGNRRRTAMQRVAGHGILGVGMVGKNKGIGWPSATSRLVTGPPRR